MHDSKPECFNAAMCRACRKKKNSEFKEKYPSSNVLVSAQWAKVTSLQRWQWDRWIKSHQSQSPSWWGATIRQWASCWALPMAPSVTGFLTCPWCQETLGFYLISDEHANVVRWKGAWASGSDQLISEPCVTLASSARMSKLPHLSGSLFICEMSMWNSIS